MFSAKKEQVTIRNKKHGLAEAILAQDKYLREASNRLEEDCF